MSSYGKTKRKVIVTTQAHRGHILFSLCFPSKFLKCLYQGRFPHPYKESFVLLPNRCRISQSTPLGGLASLFLPNRCGISQSTPFEAQRLCQHIALYPPPLGLSLLASTLSDIWLGYHLKQPKPIASRNYPLWTFPFELPLKVFKTHMLGRGFHTFIKNVSCSSPTDLGSHGYCPLCDFPSPPLKVFKTRMPQRFPDPYEFFVLLSHRCEISKSLYSKQRNIILLQRIIVLIRTVDQNFCSTHTFFDKIK